MRMILLLAAIAAFVGATFAGEILSPRDGATVQLMPDAFRDFLRKDRAERIRLIASETSREEMKRTFPANRPLGVKFAWTGGAGGSLKVWRKKDGAVFFEGRVVSNEHTLVNFEIARDYAWRVTTSEGEVLTASFRTEDLAPRLIDWPGISNARDLGGRRGLGGRRVRQGLVYRNGGLNHNASWQYFKAAELADANARGTLAELLKDGIGQEGERLDAEKVARTIRKKEQSGDWTDGYCEIHYLKRGTFTPGEPLMTEATRQWALGTLGVKTEIDLRTFRETAGMTGSPLGPTVKWCHYSASNYEGMDTKAGRRTFAKCFRVFLDERNYPIDFHCIAGADRTGSLACILNGLLGVDEEELYRDWEMSWPKKMNGTAARQNHRRLFDKLIGVFGKYAGATLNERIVQYVLSCGFGMDDIEKFRSIMLEGEPDRILVPGA